MIAVLSAFGKVFETIINKYLTAQINCLLHDSQHGFRRARSTNTNHVVFLDYVTAQMDAGKRVDAAYFDLRKAFDVVDNDVLLSKLSSYGFSLNLLKFIANYLRDRRQYVQTGKYISKEYYTRSGVSQGSTLGPTLFTLMINDVPLALSSAKCLLFADDMKLFLSVSSPSDCEKLQSDINAVAAWACANNLTFNVSKCKTITFTRSTVPQNYQYSLDGVLLERVEKIRDLGVIMDRELNFREHITSISKKASKALGFITRTSYHFQSRSVPIALYNAYVRSTLEFGAVVWDPREKKYAIMLERVQRKFARYLYKRDYGYYPFLFPSLFVSGMVGLDTLELRRKLILCMHYCMLLRNEVDNPSVLSSMQYYVPQNYTRAGRRHHRLFASPSPLHTLYANNAPTPRAVGILNQFLQDVQDADIHADNIATLYKRLCHYLCNVCVL